MSAMTDALRGRLTMDQCAAQGQHVLLIRAGVYHDHAPGPADLRAEATRLREWQPDGRGYCPHGTYTGGSGVDWMCGYCEQQDRWTEADELDSYAAELEAEYREVRRAQGVTA